MPLFVSAFKRADELAMAMESRCYNGGEGQNAHEGTAHQRGRHCRLRHYGRADYIYLLWVLGRSSVKEKTMRIKLIVEYEGTNYAGWQRQKNALSVQEVVEEADWAVHRNPYEDCRSRENGCRRSCLWADGTFRH